MAEYDDVALPSDDSPYALLVHENDLQLHAPDPPAPDDVRDWNPTEVRESFDKYLNLFLTSLGDIANDYELTPTSAGMSLVLTQYDVHLFTARILFFTFFALKLCICLYEHADIPGGNRLAIENSVLHREGSVNLVDAVQSIHNILVQIASIPPDCVEHWAKEPPSVCVPAGMFTGCVPF